MSHVEFAPLLRERIREQHEFEHEKSESYGFARGDYTADELVLWYHPDRQIGDHKLKGREVFLADHLQTLLAQRGGDRPVVALDIGGGIGMSWLRLGGVFRGEIETGRLVLAVTNLDEISRYNILKNHADQAGLYDAEELFAKNGDLINYLTTTFSLLHKQVVTTPGGSSLPLKGNTSLVHEKRSLTLWTEVPEIHIHRVGQLLTDDGLFITRPRAEAKRNLESVRYDLPGSKWYGVELAQRALEATFGLTRHAEVQTGAKTGVPLRELMFAAPHAPLIRID
jgi:hypothetical protein